MKEYVAEGALFVRVTKDTAEVNEDVKSTSVPCVVLRAAQIKA
jgi:hypothetical protein